MLLWEALQPPGSPRHCLLLIPPPTPRPHPAVPKSLDGSSLSGGSGCPSFRRQASPSAWKWKAQAGRLDARATVGGRGGNAPPPSPRGGAGEGTLRGGRLDLRRRLPLGALDPVSVGGPEGRAPLNSGRSGGEPEGQRAGERGLYAHPAPLP